MDSRLHLTDSPLTAMDERLGLIDNSLGFWDGRFDERLVFLAALEHREPMGVFGLPPVRQNAEMKECLLPTIGDPARDNALSHLPSPAIQGTRLFPPPGSVMPFFSGTRPRTWVRYCEDWFSGTPMADHEKVAMEKANLGLSAWLDSCVGGQDSVFTRKNHSLPAVVVQETIFNVSNFKLGVTCPAKEALEFECNNLFQLAWGDCPNFKGPYKDDGRKTLNITTLGWLRAAKDIAFMDSPLTIANDHNGTMVASPSLLVLAEDGKDLSAAANKNLEAHKAASLLGIGHCY
ncbi:unnamed protein product [Linum tenue]|uniref:Uncharacterized protein n=1 Tax=Linum tenue TaxID=586396 RepID=A0AAV0RRF9_9ROSI|nr:unnamed protein product [Linum tenue]